MDDTLNILFYFGIGGVRKLNYEMGFWSWPLVVGIYGTVLCFTSNPFIESYNRIACDVRESPCIFMGKLIVHLLRTVNCVIL